MGLPIVESPKYSLTVPSSGDVVTYRPYLVKEEKVLMMALESQDENQVIRALTDTISACTFGAVKAHDLATFDLEYIFMQLRSKSVGESAKLKFKCEKCDEYTEVTVNLGDIEPPKVEKAPIVKLSDNLSIQLRYPNVDTAMQLTKEGERSSVDKLFDALIATIETVFYNDEVLDAKDYSKQELLDFVESLNADQFKKLTEFSQGIPGMKKDVEFDCGGCGHHNKREMTGLQNFF